MPAITPNLQTGTSGTQTSSDHLPTIKLSDLLSNLQTGDIILGHGTYPGSDIIESVTGSEWSHCCMVVLASDIGMSSDTPYLLWESNDLTNLPDLYSNTTKEGPMLVSLIDRLQGCMNSDADTKYAWRSLKNVTRDATFFQNLKNTFAQTTSLGFPSSLDQMAEQLIGGLENNVNLSPTTMNCSMLVAQTLINVGVLSTDYVCTYYIPPNFFDDKKIKLLQGKLKGPVEITDITSTSTL